MVSPKLQLLVTILLVSEGYSQLNGCGCCYNQRCGPTPPQPGPVIPAGQFVVPAIIKPLISPCQSCSDSQLAPYPSRRPTSNVPSAPASCDNENDLDRLLYLMMCNIIDSRKCSGRRTGYNPTYSCDGSSDYSDNLEPRPASYDRSCGYDRSAGYEARSPCYCDDYAQPTPYSPPASIPYSCPTTEPYTVSTSCDNNCPEISLIFRSCQSQASD